MLLEFQCTVYASKPCSLCLCSCSLCLLCSCCLLEMKANMQSESRRKEPNRSTSSPMPATSSAIFEFLAVEDRTGCTDLSKAHLSISTASVTSQAIIDVDRLTAGYGCRRSCWCGNLGMSACNSTGITVSWRHFMLSCYVCVGCSHAYLWQAIGYQELKNPATEAGLSG